MKPLVRPALVLFALLSLLCCVVYPLAMTGIGQLVFRDQVNGSLVFDQGKPVGSALIGQEFTAPRYFWGRPSATSPMPYNAAASSGSNFGPTNPALVAEATGRIAALKAVDPHNPLPIPIDLVTSSGSGLDPDISLAAADYQAARVARARGMTEPVIRTLLTRLGHRQHFGFFGEARVNVLALNLALDRMGPAPRP
jgi:K+-transporting ATPase ATPase C chain